MLVKNALVLNRNGVFEKTDLRIEGERMAAPKNCGPEPCDARENPEEEIIDAEGLFAFPGFVDIHIHGAAGFDFFDADPESIRRIAEFEASQGVAAFCPTAMTCGEEKLEKILDAAAAYLNAPDAADAGEAETHSGNTARGAGKSAPRAAICGVRLEGPFLNPAKAGAQDPGFIRRGSAQLVRKLQERYGGLIRVIDTAPEEPGNMEMIRELSGAYGERLRISMAHTAADFGTALEAFQGGVRQLTHTYNAMPGIHHREPGPVIAALEYNAAADAQTCCAESRGRGLDHAPDGISAELIADGIHVHPAMVRFTFRAFGPERVILISDSMRAAGLPAGSYELGGQAVTVLELPGEPQDKTKGAVKNEIKDGIKNEKTGIRPAENLREADARTETDSAGNKTDRPKTNRTRKKAVLTDHPETLAGSVASLYDCFRCAVLEMGIPLADAVRAASGNPARALGLFGDYGALAPGAFANVILADRELNLRGVIIRGRALRLSPPPQP